MYIIIKCFKGVKLMFAQDSCTIVSVKCIISFNNNKLAVLSDYYDITFTQIKCDLPPKEITTIIDVKRTILDLRQKSDQDSYVKVLAVCVQDEESFTTSSINMAME
jgi:hypothetical protein